MRIFRTLAGIALLLVGLYVLIGEHFAGVSSDATINARLNVVRSPIDGQISLAVRTVGARVRAGEHIAEITDDRFDNVRLTDLERDRRLQAIALDRILRQREDLTRARAGFERQLAEYKTGRVSQITARIAEAKSIEDAASARLREAEGALGRANELNDRGVQTVATLDRVRATHDVARQDVESARQRRGFLEAELTSARSGVFIGDSYNDSPFSSQKIQEIGLRLAELQADQQGIESRITQLDEQVRAEQLRINRMTFARLPSHTTGIAWDIMVNDGGYVRRGQDLIKLIDCSSVMVTASVTERLHDQLTVGVKAQFRLFNDERTFEGTVVRLGGSGASSLYETFAVGPSAKHLERFDVTVSVPALGKEPDLACAVGRTGRVLFNDGPIATARRALMRIGL